jgi:hypothetical protein
MKRDEPAPVARRALGVVEAAKAIGISRSSLYRLRAHRDFLDIFTYGVNLYFNWELYRKG